jgi:hypothetical protein
MRIFDLIKEGGWDTTVTQGTVIKPAVVKQVLSIVQKFVDDFNAWLKPKGLGPVQIGKPTGSGAYHEQDQKENPDKIYGDIDLQMIAPAVADKTFGQFTTYWNSLANDFVRTVNPNYVHPGESKAGHPIIKIGDNDYVQVDFMWHTPALSQWGASRVTPERGVKGLLTGNMYSVLGELLGMSIQHAGVQIKTQNGQQVSFSKQKDVVVNTITTNPITFIYDIFQYEAEQILGQKTGNIDNDLRSFPGADINNIKISSLVNGVRGLANSFEKNNMFGKGNLTGFTDARDFLSKFINRYEEKAMIDINAAKRDKAETPEAKARAEEDRKKVQQGLDMVKGLFAG